MTQPLEVDSIDCISRHKFLLHFTDDTVATVTAQELADCFPARRKAVTDPDSPDEPDDS